MPLIRECVVTTLNAAGEPHLAPLGLIEEGDRWIVAPFRPSTTLANLELCAKATASFIDAAEIFAGFVTGLRDWPLVDVQGWPAPRLEAALSHAELEVESIVADELRPRFRCVVRRIETHRPFLGMNRAKAAVLEAAVLATRLNMLPREKIDSEIAYLRIAIEKTAGPAERAAWDRIMARIEQHRAQNGG
jgi:uncharacterized protein